MIDVKKAQHKPGWVKFTIAEGTPRRSIQKRIVANIFTALAGLCLVVGGLFGPAGSSLSIMMLIAGSCVSLLGVALAIMARKSIIWMDQHQAWPHEHDPKTPR
jgi:uncharacterized membrane protein